MTLSVSVITPTYNRGQALIHTLESVLQQTFTDLELIVVDDASTDDTYQVATSLSDARLRVIRHRHNKGVSGAMNTGIAAAQGEFIAILEHDDWWHPDKLAHQLPLFDNPKVGLVYCGVKFVDAEDSIRRIAIPFKRGDIYQDLLFKSYITTSSSVVVRRECFEKVGGFDEQLQGPQDYDMWIRIARHYQLDFVETPLVHFAAYAHVRLNSPKRLIPMYERLEKHFEAYDYPSALLRRRVLAYRIYTLANVHSVNGNPAQARREYLRSLSRWPFNLKCWLGLVATLGGERGQRMYNTVKSRLLTLSNHIRARYIKQL